MSQLVMGCWIQLVERLTPIGAAPARRKLVLDVAVHRDPSELFPYLRRPRVGSVRQRANSSCLLHRLDVIPVSTADRTQHVRSERVHAQGSNTGESTRPVLLPP